jgi:hypothetical protein
LKRKFLTIMVAIILVIGIASPVLASHAGYFQTSSYGAKATISAPSSAPYLDQGWGESSWVSLPLPNWVQTGWGYPVRGDYSAAYSYWEINAGVYDQQKCGVHYWGTSKIYQVSWSSPYWYAWVDGNWVIGVSGGGLPNPPCELQAMTEMNGTPVVNSYHTNVQSMRNDGSWYSFCQWWNIAYDNPPYIDLLSPSNFHTWNP